ncbi:hypothetical protein VR010_12765 [Actinomycetaceae bacterium L2_0104]
MGNFIRAAITSLIASGATRAAIARVGLPSWDRTSFSGRTVSLTEGAVATAGMMAGSVSLSGSPRLGALTAVGTAAAAGYIDDQMEERFPAKAKGLRGHLGALREGRLTSGALKIGVIGAGAALSTLTLERTGGPTRRFASWTCQSMLVAGTANLINLLDLRPGRALKACAAVAAPLALSANPVAAPIAGSVLATGAVCAPSDLSGKAMLGDLGANALGAGLGFSLAASRSSLVRFGALGAVVGLTLASERISFSKVIEENPVLSRIDQLGRS